MGSERPSNKTATTKTASDDRARPELIKDDIMGAAFNLAAFYLAAVICFGKQNTKILEKVFFFAGSRRSSEVKNSR